MREAPGGSYRRQGPNRQSYSDSVFNVLRPEGISRGDFYELHYEVDPRLRGTGVRGESWRGKALALKEQGPLGRIWHGSPPPLKAWVGGLGASAGTAMYRPEHDEVGP